MYSSAAASCASLVGAVLGIVGADHAVRPLEDLVAVLLRHADQLGDHMQRQLGGHLRDEVDLALGGATRSTICLRRRAHVRLDAT